MLAARALMDADSRSTACGGRFSSYELRAGATRAVAASGIVAHRDDLQELIDDVVVRGLNHAVDLLEPEGDRPEHIKGFMAATTAAQKVELAARFDALTRAGERRNLDEIAGIADQILDGDLTLDDGQFDAAAAIAGTDRLVSVTGPAGAGKTTMLRVALIALLRQGRQLVVVAPTKKAASVAGREIGATSLSLHALLADHGWRWGRDEAGTEVWSRLQVGELDPRTGSAYVGPRRFGLRPGDRVVVDEAGMVDLHTANALAAVAAETGAGIAMVGDHLQAMPVGHAGAMACMTRRATAVVELTAVHRFRDPDYAALTLRMREPSSRDEALAVARALEARGSIRRVTDAAQARDVMVEAWFHWAARRRRVALVTSTNEEADAINEAIQERRVEIGQLRPDRLAVGQGEQRLLEGDIVQTRLNDRVANVENRALWTIRRIRSRAVELVALEDNGDVRRVSLEYAAEHMHLAYASTVHGIQGETTDASLVGPGVDASGLYVGMTRGRAHNEVIAMAGSAAAAQEQVSDSMMRGMLGVSVDDSVRAARAELGHAARDKATLEQGREVDAPAGRQDSGSSRPTQNRQWLEAAGRALVTLEARIANMAAARHLRGADGSAEHEELGRQYDQLNAAIASVVNAQRRPFATAMEIAHAHYGRRGDAGAVREVNGPAEPATGGTALW
ncbi:MAG: AAA family ATPase [Microbacterium sp.]